MPIRHTKEGWFWGSSGPHKTRKKAVEVAQAAHAHGFQEKSLEKQQPPRPGLIPKSGDPQHPERWVRPQQESLRTRRQEDARRVVGSALEELSRKLGIPLEKPWEKKPQFPHFSPEEQNNLADMSVKAREMEGKKHTNMRPTKRNKMEKQAENYTLDDLLELLAGHKDEQENTDERLRTQLATMGVNLEQVDTRPAVDIFAEYLRKEYGVEMDKQDLQKLRFTTKRGKVESSSVPQHRLLHGRKLPHTHIEGDGYKRETFGKEEIEKQARDPWAVATATVKRMGITDFTPGSEGQQKRDEIAESLKRTQKMEKHDAPVMHDHSPKSMRGWSSPSHFPLSSPVKKGGPGSGRKPKHGIPSAIGSALGTYRRERTPMAHQGVVEAFREKEGKYDPLAGLEHPWDKPMRKAKGIYRLKRKQKAAEGRM